jgi:ribulose 1,5-bisphosphate synthetase/thiazole synthase
MILASGGGAWLGGQLMSPMVLHKQTLTLFEAGRLIVHPR